MKRTLLFVHFIFIGLVSCTQDPVVRSGSLSDIFNRDLLPSSTFSISSEKDTVVMGIHGTKLFIRKNTFVDNRGRAISGNVDVEMKEALTMEDIVKGNLTTTSNGQILQSGGMVYINASINGENISIAENNSIDVSVPSTDKKDSMQLYTGIVDETGKQLNWVEPNPIPVRNLFPATDTSFSEQHGDSSRTPRVFSQLETSFAPFKPEKIEPKSDTIISLDFDTTSYPELAEYRHVKFKLMDKRNFSAADSKRIWLSVDLVRTDKPGLYTLIFAGFDNQKEISRKYTVSPVFASGEDYEQAMEVYERKFRQFESSKKQMEMKRVEEARLAKLEQERIEREEAEERQKWEAQQTIERQRRVEEQKIALKARAEEIKQEAIRRNNQLAINLAQQNNPFVTDPQSSYVFSIKKLGWANIDKLYRNPATRQVDLLTEVSDQQSFDEIYVSLIMDKQMVYLPGYKKADMTYGFSHNDAEPTCLPVGAQATIFATGYDDGKLFFAVRKFIINESQRMTLELKETTKEALMENCKILL